MKKYIYPEMQILLVSQKDIIITSPGTETTPKEDNDGIWDFNLG